MLLVLAGPPNGLLAPSSSMKILLGLALLFTLLPSHIDEFFLVSQHVFPVEIADINEFDVLIPALEDGRSDADSVAI